MNNGEIGKIKMRINSVFLLYLDYKTKQKRRRMALFNIPK